MKKIGATLFLCIFFLAFAIAQLPDIQISTLKNHMYFLASDELQGRKTGEQGNLVAARYITESFRSSGLQSPEGVNDYYQNIVFEKRKPTTKASVTSRSSTLLHGEEVLFLSGNKTQVTGQMVFVDQGWINDTMDQYRDLDVEGKIVLSLFGIPGSNDPRDGFGALREKMKFAHSKGAIGMVEIYSAAFPWPMIQRFLNREQLTIVKGENAPDDFQYVLSNYKFTEELSSLNEGNQVELVLENEGVSVEMIKSPNVVAWLEGTDPQLKDEYVIISAHYDHVGTKEGSEEEDNIYNGARDNGIGTTAILAATEYFSTHRPKRSLLFLAFTAEEIGLLGSEYYASNPVKPLNKAIFNMNTDGGGYNDTTIVTIIGHDRVGVWDIFQEAAEAVGLKATGDPAPEQNLFDRSDNVSFAKMGVPAPTYGPGFTAFDQEIMKYYHQTADNPDKINYEYLKKFVQSYIISTEKIANLPIPPQWKTGDKYEQAYNTLYNK